MANTRSTSLLALPEVLLHEVLSWAPDSATANTLFRACPELHRLLCDPAAAALLLTRRPTCGDWGAALASCGRTCQGGLPAVSQHILRLLHAAPPPFPPPEVGKPAAPPALLAAMLGMASGFGDPATIRGLLSLPHPPPINAKWGQALRAAVRVPHLQAVQALLEGGAFAVPPEKPHTSRVTDLLHQVFQDAASSAAPAATLPLLLQNCPPEHAVACVCSALWRAIDQPTPDAVALLLPALHGVGGDSSLPEGDRAYLLSCAAKHMCPRVLQLLLAHWVPPRAHLDAALTATWLYKRLVCARVLLDNGADVNHVMVPHGNTPLSQAIRQMPSYVLECDPPICSEEEVAGAAAAFVSLLLERGVAVTAAALAQAEAEGREDVALLLRRAMAAGPSSTGTVQT